jgi:hypothetical protein
LFQFSSTYTTRQAKEKVFHLGALTFDYFDLV